MSYDQDEVRMMAFVRGPDVGPTVRPRAGLGEPAANEAGCQASVTGTYRDR